MQSVCTELIQNRQNLTRNNFQDVKLGEETLVFPTVESANCQHDSKLCQWLLVSMSSLRCLLSAKYPSRLTKVTDRTSEPFQIGVKVYRRQFVPSNKEINFGSWIGVGQRHRYWEPGPREVAPLASPRKLQERPRAATPSRPEARRRARGWVCGSSEVQVFCVLAKNGSASMKKNENTFPVCSFEKHLKRI